MRSSITKVIRTKGRDRHNNESYKITNEMAHRSNGLEEVGELNTRKKNGGIKNAITRDRESGVNLLTI